MPLIVFNASLLIGWLLVLAGGMLVHPAWGLAVAGALLIVMAMVSAFLGGLYQARRPPADDVGGA